MLTPDGIKLVEYNVRLGDPEAQVVLPLLTSDLVELLGCAADGALGDTVPTFAAGAAVCVVCASPGYPEAPRTGATIDGLHAVAELEDVLVFHAGVGADAEGRLVTAGGRVLNVVGLGATIADARARAYEGVGCIRFPGMQFRSDIAAEAAKEESRT
jgi:phosphoribosylamine--glycine ligase